MSAESQAEAAAAAAQQAALQAQTNAAILQRQQAIATVLAAMENHADPVVRALCLLLS